MHADLIKRFHAICEEVLGCMYIFESDRALGQKEHDECDAEQKEFQAVRDEIIKILEAI